MGGPTIPDIRNQSPETNLKMVLEALANLGVQIKTKVQATDVADFDRKLDDAIEGLSFPSVHPPRNWTK
jgi:hypothetical protein